MQTTTQPKKAAPLRRWLYLATGCVMLLLLGLIYAWSVFIAPLEAEFGWNRAETTMTFTLSIILFCAGGILGGVLTQRLSPRLVLVLSAAVIAAGFLAASRVTTLAGIYVAYGVCVGLGVGLAYNALISTISKWFPDKKGLCSGILLMGFGVGGMLLGSVASGLMARLGWRTMFMVFAAVFAVVLLAGALIIRPAGQGAGAAATAPPAEGMRPARMLRTRNFWVFFAWALLLVASGLIIIGHATAVAGEMGSFGTAAALMAGLVSVSNGLGRILFGALFDKLGLRTAMWGITLCGLLAPLCLLWAYSAGAAPLLVAGFVLTGAFYGGVPTLCATFAAGYGAAHFSVNFSLVNSILLFAPLLGSYLAGTLQLSSGSYTSSFAVMLAFGAGALITCLLLRTRPAKRTAGQAAK